MKRTILLLILGNFLLIGCQVREKEIPVQFEEIQIPDIQSPVQKSENLEQVQEQEQEYTVSPDRLCPFEVEIYPEIIIVGDPLYIRTKLLQTSFSSYKLRVQTHIKRLKS